METSKFSPTMKFANSSKLKPSLLLILFLAFLYISIESLRIESSTTPVKDFFVQKSPPKDVTVLFFASKNSDWMCSSIRSALIMGYKVEFFGWGDNEGSRPDWSNVTLKHIGKFQGVWNYLRSVPEKSSKLYLIADAWDSIFQLPAPKFLANYETMVARENRSDTVVVSSEGKCWPFMHWNDQSLIERLYCKPQRDIALSYTKDPSLYFQYVNTGATIGTAEALLPWFKLVLDVWHNEKENITKVGKKEEYLDDQGAAIVAFNRLHGSSRKDSTTKACPNVILDYYNELFFNVQNSDRYIYVKNTLVDDNGNMGPEALWFSEPKGSTPAIIHANGPSKADYPLFESAWLRTVDRKLLQSAWARKIGTRKFGKVPLKSLCDPNTVEKLYREWEGKKLKQTLNLIS